MRAPQKFATNSGTEILIEGTELRLRAYIEDVYYDLAALEHCSVSMESYATPQWTVKVSFLLGDGIHIGSFWTAIEASILVQAILLSAEQSRA